MSQIASAALEVLRALSPTPPTSHSQTLPCLWEWPIRRERAQNAPEKILIQTDSVSLQVYLPPTFLCLLPTLLEYKLVKKLVCFQGVEDGSEELNACITYKDLKKCVQKCVQNVLYDTYSTSQ